MALVLSERDYKLVTLYTKVAGVMMCAGGSITVVDHHNGWLGLALIVGGAIVTLAPVPMTVMRPDSYPADDELLSVNE